MEYIRILENLKYAKEEAIQEALEHLLIGRTSIIRKMKKIFPLSSNDIVRVLNYTGKNK